MFLGVPASGCCWTVLRGRVQHRLQLQAMDARQCVVVVAVPELCHEQELLVAGLLLTRSDRVVRVLAIGQPLDELVSCLRQA